MQSFRVKYLDYVKSEPVNTVHGLSYHVHFAEHEGAPQLGFWNKFAGRDFGIGANVGALVGLVALTTATAGAVGFAATAAAASAMAPLSFGLVVAGGAIGGISDYVSSNREMEKGAYIDPPSYFNRDTIIGSLGSSTTFGMVASIGMMALALAGSSVAAPIAMVINAGAFIAGTIYGGIEGAKDGYKRMDAEYTAAEKKYQNPSYQVTLSQKHQTEFDEIFSNEAALAATILPMVVKGLAQTDGTPPHNKPLNHLQTTQLSHQPPQNLVPEKVLF
jgi:hypothetical protein